MPLVTPAFAADLIAHATPVAVSHLNALAAEVLQTRGGRTGSGLGSLLEALWGFLINKELKALPGGCSVELAWFPDHAYNDFACVLAGKPWDPTTKAGEVLRVEAKSMYAPADESKAHFNALTSELGLNDVLVVLIWDWSEVDSAQDFSLVAPKIQNSFVGSALEIAELRDALHLARGGSFVEQPCPDCNSASCAHIGEPLNADGKRERRTGPTSTKPANALYAANFGGLVRMLKTNSVPARQVFREFRANSAEVHRYVSFIHSAFPAEERNQYTSPEWRQLAATMGLENAEKLSREQIQGIVVSDPTYRDSLRALHSSTK